MSFKEELEVVRETEIREKNSAFNAEMKKIIDEAISAINFDEIKSYLKDKCMKYPLHTQQSALHTVLIEPLFIKEYYWNKDIKFIKNETKPLEVYYKYKERLYHFKCYKDCNETFSKYLTEVEPNIQRLLTFFQTQLPEAKINLCALIVPNSDCYLQVNITYELRPLLL